MTNKIEEPIKPDCWTEKVKDYLDRLRKSGAVNMYGATPYIVRQFGFDREQARACLKYWMKTFK